jgi:hypothetical protein
VEACRSGPHDDEHAKKSTSTAIQRFMPTCSQQRHGEGTDPQRDGEEDRGCLRQLEVTDGREVEDCRNHQQHTAQHLQPRMPGYCERRSTRPQHDGN